MTTRRHFLCAAWLAVCALFLLSACRGPTSIADRATETVAAVVRPDAPTPPTDTPTPLPTETPPPPADTPLFPIDTATLTSSPNNPTGASTPPPADTPAPDDVKPARPTEKPAALNIKPPEISGYLLQPGSDGGWVYKDKSGKEVAHTVTYMQKFKGPTSEKTIQKGALVVSDEQLMAIFVEKRKRR